MEVIVVVLGIFFASVTCIFYYISYRKYRTYTKTGDEELHKQTINYVKLTLLFSIIGLLFSLFIGYLAFIK